MKSKPTAVLISDVHFRPDTLELATKAFVMAQDTARELGVPLVVAGDLTDTKAIIRGEVANRLIELIRDGGVDTLILVGNHDLINEKGEAHTLNFLRPYAEIIQHPVCVQRLDAYLVPYQNDAAKLKQFLSDIQQNGKPCSRTLIMHQGVQGAWMGHYVQDKTSLPKEDFADFRVISGHYHRAQDIKCGRPRRGAVGLFSYIGNPYSLSFSEAQDGPKGFQILFDDGIMEQVSTDLRTHRIYTRTAQEAINMQDRGFSAGPHWPGYGQPEDLLWIKVTGPKSLLAQVNKKKLGEHLGFPNYKLDLIPSESEKLEESVEKLSDTEILDRLIDATPEPDEQKAYLKVLWRDILE